MLKHTDKDGHPSGYGTCCHNGNKTASVSSPSPAPESVKPCYGQVPPWCLLGCLCDQLQRLLSLGINKPFSLTQVFPGGASGKESTSQCRRYETQFDNLVSKIPWSRKWQPTPVFLPGESHGQRNLADYSPQGRKESDMTEVT